MITSVVMAAATMLLSNKAHDARTAMCALIESRALPYAEDDPEYAAKVAELAWKVADAMAAERSSRSHGKWGPK